MLQATKQLLLDKETIFDALVFALGWVFMLAACFAASPI